MQRDRRNQFLAWETLHLYLLSRNFYIVASPLMVRIVTPPRMAERIELKVSFRLRSD